MSGPAVFTEPTPLTAGPRRAPSFAPTALAVFAVAFAARLWVVLGDGGLTGNYYYDPAVYYSAADGLLHGRMPYHDFVLVHPPMIALVTVPFALLGRLTTDQTGFVASNLAYTALAACNAVLVLHVGRRFGLTHRAAVAGAVFYALWTGTITAEFLTRLEPLGNFVLLVTLLVVAKARQTSAFRPMIVVGVLLGCLVNVKIWWVIPAAVILVWVAVEDRSGKRAAAAVGAALATCLVIDGPFFYVAGTRMFRAIVTAQLHRNSNGVGVHARIDKLAGLSQLVGDRFNHDSIGANTGLQLLTAVFCLLVAGCSLLAVRTALGLAMVVTLLLEAVVFFTSPTWFYTYSDYLAVPLALVVAVAAARARRPWPAVLPVFAAMVSVATFANGGLHMVPASTVTAALRDGAARVRCVVSDTPMTLIQLNALDRSFEGNCRNWVDLTGVAHGGGANPQDFTRIGEVNPVYSRDLCLYLTSGDALIISADSWRSLTPACVARIRHSPVIARDGAQVVYRMR